MRTMANELSAYHKECEDLKMDVQRYKGELQSAKQEYFARRKAGTLMVGDRGGSVESVNAEVDGADAG